MSKPALRDAFGVFQLVYATSGVRSDPFVSTHRRLADAFLQGKEKFEEIEIGTDRLVLFLCFLPNQSDYPEVNTELQATPLLTLANFALLFGSPSEMESENVQA